MDERRESAGRKRITARAASRTGATSKGNESVEMISNGKEPLREEQQRHRAEKNGLAMARRCYGMIKTAKAMTGLETRGDGNAFRSNEPNSKGAVSTGNAARWS